MPYASDFVGLCLRQAGEQYVYGAEVDLGDPNPPGPWDCSELVQWATYRVGAPMPDGSHNQLVFCQEHGTILAIDDAVHTQGALLFGQTSSWHHVAVSLGNGQTIEARGSKYGVGSWDAPGRGWTHAARVPGLDYGAPPAPPKDAYPPWPGRYLKRGMSGSDVRQWQTQMRSRGWTITADGAYGPKSEQVCVAFQKEKHIKVDGIVGPDTWKAAWAAPLT